MADRQGHDAGPTAHRSAKDRSTIGIISPVRAIAKRLANREGLELVDVVQSPAEKKTIIRVFIHRTGGVSIEDCRRFSDHLKTIMEIEEAVAGAYILEVSSPGLTRHLKTPADFKRSVGATIEVSFHAPEGAAQACGIIEEAGEESFKLKTDAGTILMAYRNVRQARPVIDWRELFRAGEKRTRSWHPRED